MPPIRHGSPRSATWITTRARESRGWWIRYVGTHRPGGRVRGAYRPSGIRARLGLHVHRVHHHTCTTSRARHHHQPVPATGRGGPQDAPVQAPRFHRPPPGRDPRHPHAAPTGSPEQEGPRCHPPRHPWPAVRRVPQCAAAPPGHPRTARPARRRRAVPRSPVPPPGARTARAVPGLRARRAGTPGGSAPVARCQGCTARPGATGTRRDGAYRRRVRAAPRAARGGGRRAADRNSRP